MTLPLSLVVVHPDGALVHRRGPLRVDDGRIVVRQLPLLLDPSSVRLSVTGGRVGAVEVALDVLGDDRAAEPALVTELRQATSGVERSRAALEALREERAALARIAPGFDASDAERRLPDPARLARWGALDDRVDLALRGLDRRIREGARALRDDEERLDVLRLRVRQASSESWWQRWLPTRLVRASVRDVEGEVTAELSYRMPGATWTPSYVLDADAGLASGRFSLRAQVTQATGEDWSGVRLSLTTAACDRRVDVPELAALRLGTRQPPAPSAFRDLPPGLDALFPADLDRVDAVEPEPEAPPPPPAVMDEEATLSAEFSLPDVLESAVELAPQAMPAPVMRTAPARKSRGLATEVAGWFGGLAGGGGAPAAPSAPAGPLPVAAPPLQAPLEQQRRQARHRVAPHAPADEAEVDVDVGADLLDYGRMRLQGFDAAPGRRGRLRPVGDDQLLAEAGVPPAARPRYRERLARCAAEAAAATALAPPPQHSRPAALQGSEVRFDADGVVDLPSDGRFHSVAVRTWSAALAVGYRAVPREDPRAFRRVEATIDHVGALLPGPVDVYVDGKLELVAPWSGTPGKGRLVLGLGPEDRIRLARNVRYREESAGVFGGSRRLHTSIEVQLASSLQRAVKVELLERLPVPADGKEPAVEQTEASPVARTWEGEPDDVVLQGGRVQVVELSPGGEGRAVLSYAVTLGARDELVGGDRRG